MILYETVIRDVVFCPYFARRRCLLLHFAVQFELLVIQKTEVINYISHEPLLTFLGKL